MKKIFLDLDGTIIDVKRKCYRLYVNVFSHGGFGTLDMATYWKMKRKKIPEEIIALQTATPMFAKYYVEKRVSLIETIDYLVLDNISDKVYTILDGWAKHYDLYLITMRRNKLNLSHQLLLLDLHKYFKHVCNFDGSPAQKEKFLRHEVSNSTASVIIGDTESDINIGKSLGIKTAAVTNGLREKRLLKEMSPDILVKSIYDKKLLGWIKNNLRGD